MSEKKRLSPSLAEKLIQLLSTLYDETESLTWLAGQPSIYHAHWMYVKDVEGLYDVFGDSDGVYFSISPEYDILIYLPRTTAAYNDFWNELEIEYGDNADVVPNFFELITNSSEENSELTLTINLKNPDKELSFARRISKAMVRAIDDTDLIRMVHYYEGDENGEVQESFQYNSHGTLNGNYYVGINLVFA